MSEVPSSLAELKIRIGKDMYRSALRMSVEEAACCLTVLDVVPDKQRTDLANHWRARCPDTARVFGEAAEQALLELPTAGNHAVATLLESGVKYVTDQVMARLDNEAFYGCAVLSSAHEVDHTNAKPYLEALIAYSRGE